MTYGEIATAYETSKDAVRAKVRRYRGQQSMRAADQPAEKRGGAKAAYEALADAHGFSTGEVKAILSSAKGKPNKPKKKAAGGGKTKSLRVLSVTDTHIGHAKFRHELWDRVVEDSRDVDVVLHSGDHLEGMSGRLGHIYELDAVGYAAQMTLCRELYGRIEKPIYGIDGNHDQWFKEKNNAGAIVGEELAMSLPNYTHLGEWEGDFHVDNLHIKLFHAGDGSAYAHSYKMQKLIESFSGGEKPHIVLSGHYHKALYQFSRNVHGYECGTICGQSRFMRGKKLQAHLGYWVIRIDWNSGGVIRIVNEFIPGYE